LKVVKVMKFLKDNNAIIKSNKKYNITGKIKNHNFSITSFDGVKGINISGYFVNLDNKHDDGCSSQREIIDHIKFCLDIC